MKYFVLFGILSGAALFQGLSLPWGPARVGWLYGALSPLLLTLAYGFRRPQWLGKSPNGLLNLGSVVVLLPYHLLNLTLLRIVRGLGLVWGPVEITERLWLGPRPLGRDRTVLSSVDGVLDLTAEFSVPVFFRIGFPSGRKPEYLCVALLDGTAPQPQVLNQALDWCLIRLKAGQTLYIHCASGHSRSVTVILGLLQLHFGFKGTEVALHHVRSLRPQAGPTDAQLRVLEQVLAKRREVAVSDSIPA